MNIISDLIARGKTREALDRLLEMSKGQDPDAHEQALMMSARFEKYRKEKRIGLIDSDVELRNVEFGIIQLSRQLIGSKKPEQKKYLLHFIIGCASILSIIFLYNKFFANEIHINKKETVASNPITPQSEKYLEEDPILIYDTRKNLKKSKIRSFDKNISANISKDSILQQIKQDNRVLKDESNFKDSIKYRAIELPQHIPEYITFSLILNYTKKDFYIIIDGKVAEIVDNSSPFIKIIQLEKSNKSRKIEIINGETLICSQSQIITNNQKISMSCVN